MGLALLVGLGAGVEGQRYFGGYNNNRRYGGYGPYAGYGGGSRYSGYGAQRNRPANANLQNKLEVQKSALKLSRNIFPSTLASASPLVTSTLATTRTTITPRTTTTTTTARVTTPQTTTRRPQTTKAHDPYLSINPKFAVIPAVPGVNTPPQNERLPKNIPSDKEASLLIPARFMPLPAVPVLESEVDVSDAVQVGDVVNSVEEVKLEDLTQERQVYAAEDFLAPSEERKQFKRCHGKCVQKFCLPVGNLAVFDKCTDKCKGICTQ